MLCPITHLVRRRTWPYLRLGRVLERNTPTNISWWWLCFTCDFYWKSRGEHTYQHAHVGGCVLFQTFMRLLLNVLLTKSFLISLARPLFLFWKSYSPKSSCTKSFYFISFLFKSSSKISYFLLKASEKPMEAKVS